MAMVASRLAEISGYLGVQLVDLVESQPATMLWDTCFLMNIAKKTSKSTWKSMIQLHQLVEVLYQITHVSCR
ncbi:MAG: hypothetical protein GY696_33215 [Gammaproteobacteria bacterium]|nr:hypothetical protein [Gammaproteobacteria bacterium]